MWQMDMPSHGNNREMKQLASLRIMYCAPWCPEFERYGEKSINCWKLPAFYTLGVVQPIVINNDVLRSRPIYKMTRTSSSISSVISESLGYIKILSQCVREHMEEFLSTWRLQANHEVMKPDAAKDYFRVERHQEPMISFWVSYDFHMSTLRQCDLIKAHELS